MDINNSEQLREVASRVSEGLMEKGFKGNTQVKGIADPEAELEVTFFRDDGFRKVVAVGARAVERNSPAELAVVCARLIAEATVEWRVARVICEQLGVQTVDVTPQANLVDDLGTDSLDRVELVMALEEEFECEIPDEDAEKTETVQDAIDLVKRFARGA